MNTLRKTGNVIVVAGTFFLAGCTAEQVIDNGPAAAPAIDYSTPSTSFEMASSPASAAPEIVDGTNQTTARQQKMHHLLQEACGYVIQQEAHVKEGFPDVWMPNSPMHDYADAYTPLAKQADTAATGDTFHVDLKKSCPQYAEIYGKNDG